MIIRSQHASNYTIIPNDIINNESLSGLAASVLSYLISKPKDWRFNARDIKRRFGIGINKVYKTMRELIEAGYAYYKRGQSRVEWFIFDRIQSCPQQIIAVQPVIAPPIQTVEIAQPCGPSHRDGFHRDGNGDELKRTEKETKKEKNNNQEVVVSFSEGNLTRLNAPTIPAPAQPIISSLLSRLDPPKVTEVCNVYNAAIEKGTIRNPVGYMRALITAVQNGTFSSPRAPVIAPGTPVVPTIEERLARQEKERQEALNRERAIDNTQYFRDLYDRFGESCLKSIPKEFHSAILNR